jgi:hypothetical protein
LYLAEFILIFVVVHTFTPAGCLSDEQPETGLRGA